MRPNPPSATVWSFDFRNSVAGQVWIRRSPLSHLAILAIAMLCSAYTAAAQVVTFSGVKQTAQKQEGPKPRAIGASSAQTSIAFSPATVAVAPASAQTVQASFAVSGYTGTFTPTATMNYGHDYTVGAATCTTVTSTTETCTFPITFIPTLPGTRKDAIIVSNGATKLATVLVYGLGQGPLSAIQPGIITPLQASTSNSYLYGVAIDGNGTVYTLGSQNGSVYSYTTAGVFSALPITGLTAPNGIAVDGAGTLYITQNAYSHIVTTYTVDGVQGALTLQYPTPNGTNNNYPYAVTVDGAGDVFTLDIENNDIYEFKADGTFVTTIINPAITQPAQLVLDDSGDIFINGYAINELTPGGTQTQINTTGYRAISIDASDTLYVAGGPLPGIQELAPGNYSGAATANSFGNPVDLTGTGLLSAPDGTVYYTDASVGLSKVDRTQALLSFGEQTTGITSTNQIATVVNIGNDPLTISNIALASAGFAIVPGNSQDCTNGKVLVPSASCLVFVTLTPTHAGNWTGTLTFTSNSLNNASTSQIVNLTGFVYGPYVTASPSPLAFVPQAINTTSATQMVTLSNQGLLYSAGIGVPTSDTTAFVPTLGTCTSDIAVGATCTINVAFTPTAAQSYSGNITIPVSSTGGGPNMTESFAVTGTGTAPAAPQAVLTPSTYTFAATVTNTTTPATFVLSNPGTAPLTGITATLSGANTADYTVGNSCGGTLQPSTTCNVFVYFKPLSAATFTGTLTVSDNASSSPQTASFTGAGIAAPAPVVTLSSTSLTFPSTPVGSAAPAQTITVTNSGNAPLTLGSINVVSANSGNFTETATTCSTTGGSLNGGASCTITISFTPTSVGSLTGQAIIADNAVPSPQTVSLSGTGAAVAASVALTPNPLTFPNTQVGVYNAATATLTNSGSTPLTGIAISITGANASLYSIYPLTSCGTTLAAGANCTIVVHFTPLSTGNFPATLSVADSAAGSPQTVPISAISTAASSPQVQFNPVQLNAIAGTGASPANCLNPAEPGPALQTQLCGPTAVATDMAGNTYIVEPQDNVVKKLDTSGNITTFAGMENTGPGSFSGDNGPANAANLSQPLDVAVDALGNVYISDSGNGRIREVNAATGIITTFVGGTGGQYFTPGTGTGVTLSPAGIAFDPSGNLYIAEPSQQIVVMVTSAGSATLFAGVQTPQGPGTPGYNGDNILATAAELNFPTSVATDRAGNVYIADSQNYRIRYVNENAVAGMISTVAGNGTQGDTGDGGVATSAEINPLAIAINLGGDIFISDGSTIRKVDGQGNISTFAGGGTGGLGGPATSAMLQGVGNPGIDNNGDVLIPISTTPEVLSAGPTGILQFGNQAVGAASASQTVTIENTGNGNLTDFSQTPLTATGDFNVTGGTCSQSTDGGYQPGSTCTLTVTFTPTAAGALTGSIAVPSNASNSPQSIILQGTGTQTAPPAPQAVLSPTSLTFASTTAGAASSAQTITLSNPGTAALSISGVTVTGANAADFAETTTCSTSLAAGANCTISTTFTPAAAGSFTAAISVADNASGSPQTATLAGTGAAAPVADFTTNSTTPAQTVKAGGAAQYTIAVQSTNGAFSSPVTLTATGLPSGATVSFQPPTVTPGSAGATSIMTIQTATNLTGAARPEPWPFLPPGITVALVAPLFWRRFRKGAQLPAHKLLLGAFVFLLLGVAATSLTGCGAGFPLPAASTTYTITVTGTSGTDTHSTTVSLIVQ